LKAKHVPLNSSLFYNTCHILLRTIQLQVSLHWRISSPKATTSLGKSPSKLPWQTVLQNVQPPPNMSQRAATFNNTFLTTHCFTAPKPVPHDLVVIFILFCCGNTPLLVPISVLVSFHWARPWQQPKVSVTYKNKGLFLLLCHVSFSWWEVASACTQTL
jgi:hypothetical protein